MTILKIIIFIYFCKTIETFTLIDREKSHIYYRQWNASRNGTLSFKFKTYDKWGLLMYTDNSRSPNSIRNAVLIKLLRAKLSVTVQMGDDDFGSKKTKLIGDNLDNLQWHYVELKRNGRGTTITLDKKEDFLNMDGQQDKLALNSGLYVGGLSDRISKSRSLVDRSVLAVPRFIGCIEDLKFSHSHDLNQIISPIIKTVEVKRGCLNACVNETCANNGQCRNKFTKIDCDCKGTGFEGSRCTKVADSIQFKGNSFLTINIAKAQKTATQTVIQFRFKTLKGDGVIFATQNGNDHLLLELSNNVICLSIDLGGGHHISQVNNIPFNDGVWHVVEVFRKGRDTSIVVDKKYCVNSSTGGVFSFLDFRDSPLYVGGHSNPKVLSKINSNSKRNFTGCIQQAYFNGMDIIYKVLQIRSPRFKKYGTIYRGCDVVKKKVIETRSNQDSSISVSVKDKNKPLKKRLEPSQVPGAIEPAGITDPNALSRQSIVWITVGLVIGSIILVITVGVIVHNVRYRYRAVLLSSSLKSLRDNNSLNRRFSSNDRILRGSSDRMIHGSIDRFMRSSTDRLIRGSTDRIMRNSTDRMMRNSTDRLGRGSVDRLLQSSSDRRLRASNDRILRGSTDRSIRASTDRIMRTSTDRISRGDRSQRCSSVQESTHMINDRNPCDKTERASQTTEHTMDSITGRMLSDINDNEVLKSHKDSSSPVPRMV